MKEINKLKVITVLGLMSASLIFSCTNNSKTKEGSGQSDNIAPSAADETRYNLSEQQKMSMQKDTTLADSTLRDSANRGK